MRKKQGFDECGYHYYITKDDMINFMADVSKVVSHAKGINAYSIEIAYEGGLNDLGVSVCR